MPKIRFLQTRIVQDGTGTKFEAGSSYELPRESCDRWIKRGVAELVSERSRTTEPETVTKTGEIIPSDSAVAEAKAKADAEKAADEAKAAAAAEAKAKARADKKAADEAAEKAASASDDAGAKAPPVATGGGFSAGTMGKPR